MFAHEQMHVDFQGAVMDQLATLGRLGAGAVLALPMKLSVGVEVVVVAVLRLFALFIECDKENVLLLARETNVPRTLCAGVEGLAE